MTVDPAKLDDYNGITDRVVALRCQGKSYVYISKVVGIGLQRVKNILDAEFRERFAGREELRQRTALELDYIMRPFMEKLEKTAASGNPDRHAAEIVLKTIESRKRLFALDEPVRLDVKHTIENLSDEQLARELATHGIEYKQLPPAVQHPPSIPVNFEQIEDAEYVEAGAEPNTLATALSEDDDGLR